MTQADYDFLCSVGGAPIMRNGREFADNPGDTYSWNFGLCGPDAPAHLFLTKEEDADRYALTSGWPSFSIDGNPEDGEKKVILSDLWRDPRVLQNTGGKVFSGFKQLTGSCVGSGSGNALFALACVEVVRLGDPEEALIPWWPLSYGRGRYHMGSRSSGEGSTSEGQVEAFRKDGILRAGLEGLPSFTDEDGLTLTRAVEMEWSNGARIDERWLSVSRKNLVRTAAVVRNADEGREAIRNGYPILWCGSWGGLMRCPTAGDPPVLLNRQAGTWMHNQTCLAWWDHPTLGELFGILNQWGHGTHGTDPAGLPPGAYWIRAVDFDRQARGGSCIAISQFDGFPAQRITWYI